MSRLHIKLKYSFYNVNNYFTAKIIINKFNELLTTFSLILANHFFCISLVNSVTLAPEIIRAISSILSSFSNSLT